MDIAADSMFGAIKGNQADVGGLVQDVDCRP